MTEKSSDAFRTISEVADDLHVPQHVLRFWEGRFPQIKPLKRAGGRRYYRPEDVELLARIRDLLYTQGYTIKGVQNLWKDGLDAPAKPALPTDALPVEGDPAADAPVVTDAGDDVPEDRPFFVSATAPEEEQGMDDEPPMKPVEAPAVHEPSAPPPPMFGLFSRVDPAPPPVPVQPQTPVPTGLSSDVRIQLTAIMDELEQLRFLLRAQD